MDSPISGILYILDDSCYLSRLSMQNRRDMELGHYLVWILWFVSVRGSAYEYEQQSITLMSKHEFCSGNHQVSINPKHIPELLDYLKYCSSLAKQPNVDSYAKRQAVIHLFNAATPVIHRAFFDSKTALKYVVRFTKLKHDAVQYANYANKYGDHSMYSRKKISNNVGTLVYSPMNDKGSYNLNEDLRVCDTILNRHQNTSVRNIIKASQLPRVAKAARIVTFPPFNLSIAVTSEDTPYMILDMYVLTMRCLSLTDLHRNTTVQVSEHLVGILKRKVMPYVPPHEFERAYSSMMSMARSKSLENSVGAILKTVPTTLSGKRSSATARSRQPVVLKIHPIIGDEASDVRSGITIIPVEKPKKSFRDAFMALLRGRLKSDAKDKENSTLVTDERMCRRGGTDPEAVAIISAILGICGTLAVILYCLLYGCCGWLTLSTEGAEELDEVDECLEGYTRLSPGNRQDKKCYCTLADTNQMEIIAALHQRCELLSKKICRVVREISKENILENQESMDMLREFVRSVSTNVVDENETIYRFGKSMSSLLKPQNKILSVKRSAL